MTFKPGQFIWYELLTTDLDSAATFYTAVTGWAARDSGTPGMDYRIFSASTAMVGGLVAIPPAAAAMGMPPMWLGYVRVPDVDAALTRTLAAGGAVRMPPMDIAGVGRMATIADPQGAGIYVMRPEMAEGTSTAFAPGARGHVGWNELHTTDWQAALAFYGAEFGWGKSGEIDMGPMGTYALFHAGAEAIGGMMNSPNARHPFWMFYFNVDEINAARARVEAAGGRVVNGPHEVPGGSWVLQAMDPQGAMFGLVAPVCHS